MVHSLDPNIALRILIVDSDKAGASRLAGALSRLRTDLGQSLDNASVSNIPDAYDNLERYQPNVIFIDLISTGLRDSVTFVQHVRLRRPTIVFVLYCTEHGLAAQAADLYSGWGSRLKHYFLLTKGGSDEEFEKSLSFNLVRAQFDLYTYGAQETLARTNIEQGNSALTEVQISKLQTQVVQLARFLQSMQDNSPKRAASEGQGRRAFVVMSLVDRDVVDVYEIGIKEFLGNSCNFEAYRADEHYPLGLIIQRIYEEIHSSSIVIAELSHPRPNCYYEIGFADAIGKPVIRLARIGTELPFDVNQYPFIFYEGVVDLRQKFGKALIDLGFLESL